MVERGNLLDGDLLPCRTVDSRAYYTVSSLSNDVLNLSVVVVVVVSSRPEPKSVVRGLTAYFYGKVYGVSRR
jgi:hypothetical protein